MKCILEQLLFYQNLLIIKLINNYSVWREINNVNLITVHHFNFNFGLKHVLKREVLELFHCFNIMF